jgi:hypothetical protein
MLCDGIQYGGWVGPLLNVNMHGQDQHAGFDGPDMQIMHGIHPCDTLKLICEVLNVNATWHTLHHNVSDVTQHGACCGKHCDGKDKGADWVGYAPLRLDPDDDCCYCHANTLNAVTKRMHPGATHTHAHVPVSMSMVIMAVVMTMCMAGRVGAGHIESQVSEAGAKVLLVLR